MASSVSFELDAPVSAVVAPTNAQDKKPKVNSKPTPTSTLGMASAKPRLKCLASKLGALQTSRGVPYITYSSRFPIINLMARPSVSNHASATREPGCMDCRACCLTDSQLWLCFLIAEDKKPKSRISSTFADLNQSQ